MPSSDYGYSLLPTTQDQNISTPVTPKRRWTVWHVLISLSALLNAVGLVFVCVKTFKGPPVQSFSALDDFQQLCVLLFLMHE